MVYGGRHERQPIAGPLWCGRDDEPAAHPCLGASLPYSRDRLVLHGRYRTLYARSMAQRADRVVCANRYHGHRSHGGCLRDSSARRLQVVDLPIVIPPAVVGLFCSSHSAGKA